MKTLLSSALLICISASLIGQTINLPTNCNDCSSSNSLYCDELGEVSSFTRYQDAFLIVSDGNLYGFGENFNRMLGFPVSGETVSNPRKLEPIEALNKTWKQAYSTYENENRYDYDNLGDFYALATTGEIYIWGGQNNRGYVNGGSSSMTPRRIPSSDQFTQIYIGQAQSAAANRPYYARTSTGAVKYFRADQTPTGNLGVNIIDSQDGLDYTAAGILVIEDGTNNVYHINESNFSRVSVGIQAKKVSKNTILGTNGRLYVYNHGNNTTTPFMSFSNVKDMDFSLNYNGVILTNSNGIYVAEIWPGNPSGNWRAYVSGTPAGDFDRVEIEDYRYFTLYGSDAAYNFVPVADMSYSPLKAPYITEPQLVSGQYFFEMGCF